MSDHGLKKRFPSPAPSQQEVDAFVEASGKNDAKAVVSFLDKYADAVDRKNSSHGSTAMTHTAYAGKKEMLELLLARGASVDEKDKSGWTPSMYAAACGDKEFLLLLLDKGAHVEGTAGRDEWTLLMLAAASENPETVELLIERGANLESKDCVGNTALDIARKNEEPVTAKVIERHLVLQKKERALAEIRTQEQAAARLEKLKNRRPPKSPLKKDRP